jgi:hypothetical protein
MCGPRHRYGKFAVCIEGNHVALGDLVEDLDLVVLALTGKKLSGLPARHLAAQEGTFLATARCISASMAVRSSGGKRAFEGKFVVETVFDGRSDGHLAEGKSF